VSTAARGMIVAHNRANHRGGLFLTVVKGRHTFRTRCYVLLLELSYYLHNVLIYDTSFLLPQVGAVPQVYTTRAWAGSITAPTNLWTAMRRACDGSTSAPTGRDAGGHTTLISNSPSARTGPSSMDVCRRSVSAQAVAPGEYGCALARCRARQWR
jgi:hypothetical protein